MCIMVIDEVKHVEQEVVSRSGREERVIHEVITWGTAGCWTGQLGWKQDVNARVAGADWSLARTALGDRRM